MCILSMRLHLFHLLVIQLEYVLMNQTMCVSLLYSQLIIAHYIHARCPVVP